MDKNKFWLGGRLFNTASPRLGAPTQRKARPQDGRPNATQGTSASWAPQHNAMQGTSASWAPQGTSATQGTSASWAPQRNARHVRKMGAQTQREARPQVGRPNATQGTSASWAPQRKSATQMQGTSATQGTSASWAPQRNARHVPKMVPQTQNSSATKTSTHGSTRLKDELEDG
jgi:hypothetical protein